MSTLNRTMNIAAQEALNVFTAELTPVNAFATDFSPVTRAKGSAIQVPLVSALTATTFNASYTGTGGTVNTVTVNLNNHRIVTVDLTDVQQLNTDITVQSFAQQMGSALAKIVCQDIWSLVLTTNFAAATVTTLNTNWTKTQARALRLALSQQNVPLDNRSLVIDEVLFDALLGDSSISQAMQYGGPEAIREGRIPRLLGMNIYPTNLMPSNSITLYGFAAHKDAVAVAFRGFDGVVPNGAYEDFQTVTAPNGIAMNSRLLYDPTTGKRHWSMECLFGYAVGVSTGLRIATGPN